ncbi:MAG: heavy-metal-associated domain-containing protein [Anaerolineae bacterium]|nr:heavy-metal-associated domain-containing protein [Anaerolineae bacterium]
MAVLTLDVPAMYGDHHVVEVRRLLLILPGITDVYASSYLKTVEVEYDPTLATPDTISAALQHAGYLQELAHPQETGIPAYGDTGKAFFRHTAAYAQTGKTISFAQPFTSPQRPLIPCPGMETTLEAEE